MTRVQIFNMEISEVNFYAEKRIQQIKVKLHLRLYRSFV